MKILFVTIFFVTSILNNHYFYICVERDLTLNVEGASLNHHGKDEKKEDRLCVLNSCYTDISVSYSSYLIVKSPSILFLFDSILKENIPIFQHSNISKDFEYESYIPIVLTTQTFLL